MKDILQSKFIQEMCDVTANMYRQGWDERNGGNVSVILDEKQVVEYLDTNKILRTIPLNFVCDKSLAGKYFLFTGTGKYFKNVIKDPENNLGIIRIADDCATAELLWGWKDGGKFTSECPAHLMTHATRLAKDPEHKIVMHTHPTYTMCMSAVVRTDDRVFTEKLWRSNTEAIVVFPDGVGVLPCMICGTEEIGRATADKMNDYRLVVWTNHGIYGTGKDIDETFGLIETVEKTAQVYMLTLGHVVNQIGDDVLQGLVDLWHLKPLDGILGKKA